MKPNFKCNFILFTFSFLYISGGTKITTATALITVLTTDLGLSLEESVDSPRLHHQLSPMEVSYQTELAQGLIQYRLWNH